MKKIIKDCILTLKYLLVSFIISFFLVIVLFVVLSANEIERYHYLYSNFIVFYYLILKINIVIYALLPISLMITALISFSYASARDCSSIGASLGLILFCLIIFGSLYIALFQDGNRINIISKIYQPKPAQTTPFFYNNSIITYEDNQFYFENNKAYYFENNNLVISDFKINLKKNILTIEKLNNGIGKDYRYLDEIGTIESLLFLKPIIGKINSNFEELTYFLSNNKGIYFLLYLAAFFFTVCWIPFLFHNENWPMPYHVLSFILIILFSILFLAVFKFSIVYLKDLKISKVYIRLFPVFVFGFIFIIEALLLYIRYSRKIFHSKIAQTKKMQMARKIKT